MTRTAYDREHEIELQKHEWRPGDNPVLGKFTDSTRTAAPIDAIEIAVLVKGMKNITEAAKLIDQYAAAVAAGAKLEGVQEAYDRMDAVMAKVFT